MFLTCIIVTKDRPDDLKRCLASLHSQTQPAEQIIVVEGGAAHTPSQPGLKIDYFTSAPGITKQRNVARDKVHPNCEVVVYCDDDTELAPNTFKQVRTFFSQHPQAIGLTGQLDAERHDSFLKKLFGAVTLLYTTRPYGFTYGVFNLINPVAQTTTGQWLPGAFMCYRWSKVAQLEFDEWFNAYGLGEDFDFSYRAGQLGELWADPNIQVQHHHSLVNRNWEQFGYMRMANRRYLQRKLWPNQAKYWLGRQWANVWLLLVNGLRAIASKRYRAEFKGELRGLFGGY